VSSAVGSSKRRLLQDIENQRKALGDALAEATEQTKAAEMANNELAQIKAEYEDVKTLEERHAQRIATLLEDQVNTIRNLEEVVQKDRIWKVKFGRMFRE